MQPGSPRKCNSVLARLLAQNTELTTATQIVRFEKDLRPTVGRTFQYQLI